MNALDYRSLESEDHEWDNVPMLVSHFIIHLEKYVRELSKNASTFNAQEGTGALREDLEKKIEELADEADFTKKEDKKEKEKMRI